MRETGTKEGWSWGFSENEWDSWRERKWTDLDVKAEEGLMQLMVTQRRGERKDRQRKDSTKILSKTIPEDRWLSIRTKAFLSRINRPTKASLILFKDIFLPQLSSLSSFFREYLFHIFLSYSSSVLSHVSFFLLPISCDCDSCLCSCPSRIWSLSVSCSFLLNSKILNVSTAKM